MIILKDLIGLTETAVVAKIKDAGMKFRIRAKDGQAFMGACDYRTDRVNLYIEKDLVTKATLG